MVDQFAETTVQIAPLKLVLHEACVSSYHLSV